MKFIQIYYMNKILQNKKLKFCFFKNLHNLKYISSILLRTKIIFKI